MSWDVLAGIAASAAAVGLAALAVVGRGAIGRAAERGVDSWFDDVEHAKKFQRELAAVRGVQRQELRFRAYSGLYAVMRPLAVYGDSELGPTEAGKLAKELSEWYFSEGGGLLLTEEAKTFYFTLQDVLRFVEQQPDWRAERADPEADFERALERSSTPLVDVKDYLDDPSIEWPDRAADHAEQWRTSMRRLCEEHWDEFPPNERFAVIQQVSSRLRTVLTKDLESRSW